MTGMLLFDGHGRRKALDMLDSRLLHLADELACVRAKAFDVPPLPLGVDGVHGQRGFARPAGAAADGHLIAGNIDVDILEVVLTGAANADGRREAGDAGWGSRVRKMHRIVVRFTRPTVTIK